MSVELLTSMLLAFLLVSFSFAAEPRNITNVLLTSYGFNDNCPPSGTIEFPKIHKVAGGIGTYRDPITFASFPGSGGLHPGEIGARVCSLNGTLSLRMAATNARRTGKPRDSCNLDLWIGPDALSVPASALVECENALTSANNTIEASPPSNYPVNANFHHGVCAVATVPCTDTGNDCGNSCDLPETMSCERAAVLFGLKLARFQQLNPKINCSVDIPKHTEVCQGGTCGD